MIGTEKFFIKRIKRTQKAIGYIENHKAKKCIVTAKMAILKDLERASGSMRISGATCTFMTAICNRFRSGFFLKEYIAILNGLTAIYDNRQKEFYDWV